MKCSGRREKVRVAALAAAVAGFAGFAGFSTSVARAQFVWDDGASPDHNWNTAANWSPDGVPTAADSAQWAIGTSPDNTTVTLSAAAAASDLQVTDVATTFNLNNFALTVSAGMDVDGDAAHATFNGPGTVSIGGLTKLGLNRPFSPPADHARVTAKGGATVTSAGLTLGDYRGGGILTVDGAGTTWSNASVSVLFGRGEGYGYAGSIQPKAQLFVTNGGHFTHDLGSTSTPRFTVSRNDHTDSKIVVNGAGSRLNLTGTYGSNLEIGGYGASTIWEFTNGGVLRALNADLGLSFAAGTGTNTFTISGAGSKMTASKFAVAGRSASDIARGRTIVNLGTGGVLEGTDTISLDERTIAVGDRGRITLQGGTVSVPTNNWVTLIDAGVTGEQATLEGVGTIAGGDLRVQGDSMVRPGGTAATGTITVQHGNLHAESPTAQLPFDLSTTNGAHDRIQVSASGKLANIPGVISYTNIGSGSDFSGTMDFLLADDISYSGLTGGDIPLNTDGLDALLNSAGYTTKVTGAAPDSPGEYRYFIEPNAAGALDVLRLQLFGTGVVAATWIAPGDGSWFNSSNWSNGNIPNGAGTEANFLGSITATSTVLADSPVTVGTMRFNNATSTYHIGGAGTLTLQVNSGSALVDVQSGTHKINLPLTFASDTTLNVALGSTLQISDPVTVNAGKTVVPSGGGKVLYEFTVNVLSGGSITFGNSTHMAGLTLASGAGAHITPGANKVLNADSLNVGAGKLNIQDNKVVTDNPVGSATAGVYNGVSGLIQSGRGNGTWNGASGIVTSQTHATAGSLTSIGVATAAQVKGIAATATDVWAGETVTGTETLVMYTYGGDANLDGKINIDDYGHIDTSVGLINQGWFNGDFNYDGKINIDDYGIIDVNVGVQGAPFATAAEFSSVSGASPVPEPTGFAVMLATALLASGRRRRRPGFRM